MFDSLLFFDYGFSQEWNTDCCSQIVPYLQELLVLVYSLMCFNVSPDSGITMVNEPINLVDLIWSDRPTYSSDPAFVLGLAFAGMKMYLPRLRHVICTFCCCYECFYQMFHGYYCLYLHFYTCLPAHAWPSRQHLRFTTISTQCQ